MRRTHIAAQRQRRAIRQTLRSAAGLALLAGVLSAARASAAPLAQATFFGPTPYLSTADIPAGFYGGGTFDFLEDFEDGTLDGGITASAGSVLAPGAVTDSVDADDGAIDGSGSTGFSHLSTGVTFTFSPPLPTAAGLVWTDGSGGYTFEAFGPGAVSLGTVGPVTLGDGLFTGGTAEDRFFGVQDAGGIEAIRISGGAVETDHVQYGQTITPVVGGFAGGAVGAVEARALSGAVPAPLRWLPWLALALALGGIGVARTRRSRTA
jgi:hypothetical protein